MDRGCGGARMMNCLLYSSCHSAKLQTFLKNNRFDTICTYCALRMQHLRHELNTKRVPEKRVTDGFTVTCGEVREW